MAGIVRADMLFVGLTRPPMIFGVSYTFALINFMICLVGYIITTKFTLLVAIFPVHAIGYYICSKEPLFIDLFMVKSSKCSRSRNKLFHGVNSYDIC